MKKTIFTIITLSVILIMTGCSTKEEVKDGMTIAVSVLPQEAIVKAIAGDKVGVMTIIPPGSSPTNYQPTPRQIQEFSKASIYMSIGVPSEEGNIFPNMVDDRDDLRVLHMDEIVGKVFPARYFEEDADHEDEHEEDADHEDEHEEDADHEDEHEEHADHEDEHEEDADHEDEHEEHADHDDEHEEHADHDDEHEEHADHDDHEGHDHSGADPHIWMSPKRMMVMAETIYEVLSEEDPDNEAYYRANLEAFNKESEALIAGLTETFEHTPQKKFIIMHPSMGYFAEDFGLEMVALEKEGKASTASHLQEVIEYAKDNKIKVIFYQAEFDSSQAKTLAEEIGGEVMMLDTLAVDYFKNMHEIEEIFKKVLSE